MSNGELDVFTVEEVAHRYLRVSERTIYRLIDSGQLDAFKVGVQWRITRAALEGYMQRNAARPQGATRQPADDLDHTPGKDAR